MKIIKIFFVTAMLLAAVVFGVYYIGSKFIADEVVEQVTAELDSNGQLDAVKQELQNDPQFQAFAAEGKAAKDRDLPFRTKDQAVRVLIKKFSVSELAEVQSKMKEGMSAADQQELIERFGSRLSEDELLALKVLAYEEMMNN